MLNAVNLIKLREQIPNIIQETKDTLITLNQDQLYYLGQDSSGQELKPYSFLTEHYKRMKSQPFDRTTLRDTGSFYKGFNIKTSNTFITFDSTDSKTPDLQEKYGAKIFGMNDESKAAYSFGAFYEGVKKHITEKSGLQFM